MEADGDEVVGAPLGEGWGPPEGLVDGNPGDGPAVDGRALGRALDGSGTGGPSAGVPG